MGENNHTLSKAYVICAYHITVVLVYIITKELEVSDFV